jgi:hypothetical protein
VVARKVGGNSLNLWGNGGENIFGWAVNQTSEGQTAVERADIRGWILTRIQAAISWNGTSGPLHHGLSFVRVARNSPGVVQRERRFRRTSQSMTTGCCWPLLPVRPPRDGSFFVRSPAGVNGATLQENAPEASSRLVFRLTSRLFFQSRGPVEDDGNGRGLSLADLGICGHQEALPVRRANRRNSYSRAGKLNDNSVSGLCVFISASTGGST